MRSAHPALPSCRLLLIAALLAAPALPAFAAPAALPNDGLSATEHPGLDQIMLRSGAALKGYSRVILDPITVQVERRRDEIILQPRDIAHAGEYFTDKLADRLGPALVTTAGPATLRLNIVITEFVANHPFIAERKDRIGSPMLQSYAVGEAAFQAVLTDSVTGQVLATIADADRGLSFEDNMNLQTQYGDADRIIRRWAGQIGDLLAVTKPSS